MEGGIHGTEGHKWVRRRVAAGHRGAESWSGGAGVRLWSSAALTQSPSGAHEEEGHGV